MSTADGHPHLGVCLDSCHLWVSGVDVTDRTALDAMLDELDGSVGLDRLRALHVNDALDALGSNRDRHANIGEGVIGEGLERLPRHPTPPGPARGARDARPGQPRGGRGRARRLRELHARGVDAAAAR